MFLEHPGTSQISFASDSIALLNVIDTLILVVGRLDAPTREIGLRVIGNAHIHAAGAALVLTPQAIALIAPRDATEAVIEVEAGTATASVRVVGRSMPAMKMLSSSRRSANARTECMWAT